MARSKPMSLLAQLSKRARDDIARIMQQRDGELPLHEFLAKRWDYTTYWRRPGSEEENAKNMATMREGVAKLYPQLADEFIDQLMPYFFLRIGLREAAIARRIVFEDPGELARGLAIDGRLYKLLRAREHGYPAEILIEQCAIRQCNFAANCVQGLRAGHDALVSVGDVIPIGITAILQQNWDALQIVASPPPDQRTAEWVEALYECLVGVAERQPALVAKRLSAFMLGIKNLRQKDGLTDAVNLTAQGLYRLCEWVDPHLVSQIDVYQPRPWDAQFHRWCEDHPDPLAGVDLTSISPALHETLILDQWPAWLPSEPSPRWEILLTGMGKQLNFDRGMGPYRKVLLGMLENGPVVTHWNLTRQNAEHRCHEMAQVGGQTEIRPSAGTNYRLFSLKGSKVTEWGTRSQ
jgi:hypothetical protein